MRRADRIVLYGEEDLQALKSRGIDSRKIFIAPNTINIPNHRDCSGLQKNKFIYVGRLQERKGLKEILRAYAAIVEKLPPNVTFDIVGDGEIRASLEKLATELLPPGKFKFHGSITDHNTLLSLMGHAYAYVSDNVGLGLLHSFAYGIPVVTFQHGEQKKADFRHGPEVHDLIDNENGLYCTTFEDLRDKMCDLATDQTLTQNLGRNAYKLYAEKRQIHHMVEGFSAAVRGCHASKDS